MRQAYDYEKSKAEQRTTILSSLGFFNQFIDELEAGAAQGASGPLRYSRFRGPVKGEELLLKERNYWRPLRQLDPRFCAALAYG